MTGFALRFQNFQGKCAPGQADIGRHAGPGGEECPLTSGGLTPIASPKLITSAYLCGRGETVHRMFDDSGSILAVGIRRRWVKGPIVGDERFRIFFTSDASSPATRISTATSSPPIRRRPSCWAFLTRNGARGLARTARARGE